MNTTHLDAWLKTQLKLKSFVYNRVKDQALTDDIVQDVFLKVYLRADSIRDENKINSWIYQIARNLIIDHFRAKGKPNFAIEQEEEPVTNYNECVSGCLKEMLHTLPEKYREALELTELKNMSQLKLAEQLQISYSGAKSRVQRAKQMLREKMDKAYNIKIDAYGNAIVCKDRLPCGCE